MKHKTDPHTDIKVNFKAGGSFVELPPQFSLNAENVYVGWKNRILGYNTKTGALYTEFKGIESNIVGFGVHRYDSHECITACSSSGEIITWKVSTFLKVFNLKINLNCSTFQIIPSETGPKALISYRNDHQTNFSILDVSSGTRQKCSFTINKGPYNVDISNDNFFAVTHKSSLNLVKFREMFKTYTYCNDNARKITCVACHPEYECILTGDNIGRVVVWQKLFTSKPSKAVFHWHTLPVRCLSFSTIGSYFYSGANEAVLVQWQIDNAHEKKFLPRLPSTIAKITVSHGNKFIAVATDDNAVRIIDARFDNVSLIQNLVIGSFESGIIFDPKTKALVMNGNVGHIQFYSPLDNSLLYNVDIVGQNKISNENNCEIENTKVSKIAISKNGLWMSSVEMRRDPEFSSELRMKFWKFDLKIQNFKLNTSIEDPHENGINAIEFQPYKFPKCVTVGEDKKFKVWCLTEAELINKKDEIWNCLCVGFYHDLPCKDLSFSIDGSILAVSFNNNITVWLPDSCELKCCLSHPICRNEIFELEFGTRNHSHLIVSAMKDRICVWNLLTLTLLWTVPADVSTLISDPVTANMALITTDNYVVVFVPNSAEPIFVSHSLLDNKKVVAAAFVPGKHSNNAELPWYKRCPIFFLDQTKELFSIGSDEEDADSTMVHGMLQANSVFSMTIPEVQVDKSKSVEPVHHLYQKDSSHTTLKKYLEAPIHTMIPIRLMCSSLLKSMVLEKPSDCVK